jgi:hypothetical protein
MPATTSQGWLTALAAPRRKVDRDSGQADVVSVGKAALELRRGRG